MESRVEFWRGDAVESVHGIHVAVVRQGRLEARSGDPALFIYLRSAAKPFQALPLVEDGVADRFGLTPREVALACGSHSSQVEHVETARSILRKVGLGEGALLCGGHTPLSDAEGRRLALEGRMPGPLESNCSGKHAGMLALAVHHGWPVDGYVEADHPVQQRMALEVSRWTGVPVSDLVRSVDGCGVVCFGAPLEALARGYSAFARAAGSGEPAHRVWDAMRSHPDMVAGRGRLCTDLMTRCPDLLAKLGAEGVYVVARAQDELAVALKVADGARRAVAPAVVAVLEEIGVLDGAARATLKTHREPQVRNTCHQVTGTLTPRIRLEAAPSASGVG